ncbi:mannosyl-oligosaccharide alpha-1,2-mannosidase [Thraustotheca clavata]|uniref:alpha-1,2-Mannosidase n=1 Tax=Thraustotheca clavata TaxID=74557 RepID=A0A1V9Z1T0_9STRA|nr:mannosyl-oligosaccharide alpha-1,2-mannosidase [Thraustotheca clavata]
MGFNPRSLFQWLLVLSAACFFFNILLLSGNTSISHQEQRNNLNLRGPDDSIPAKREVSEKLMQEPQVSSKAPEERRKQVVEMMKWAWKGYETYAFGYDALDVNEMKGTGLPGHDMAISLIDSLDTLYIMGLNDEFQRAVQWTEDNLADRFEQHVPISIFETTIRILGGLLSAYNLSGRQKLLTLADDLGTRLLRGLHTDTLPNSLVDLIDGHTSGASFIAEFTTIQLEFKYLSILTKEQAYYDAVEELMDKVDTIVKRDYPDGVLPVNCDNYNGRIHAGPIKLGAGGDSYYEYLLKQWIFSGKKETKYKDMYMTAVNGMMKKLVGKTKKSGLVFLGELEISGKLSPKMDHLVCFIPGMLTLGYMNGMPKSHLDLAEQLLETCWEMYNQMGSKLAPEIAYFEMTKTDRDINVASNDAFNILRPETVESLMIMYRLTKDEKYRERGGIILDAFERNCKLENGGYSSVSEVDKPTAKKYFRREMESFFMAETLKYLYLLFSDDSVVPLDTFVFNTEAHPFPIQQ